ncbi:hypothetical protein NLG97_g8223 [Lecanicillium saksenae]|uniref:Uncharacterized protein n=1 Tax=Lecanicillium saksenae TaxID=468837 RepID=A0ACC1QJL8_9HYPO|nr:hypothetical protein NLG97_g8223 [Lecanicillium saksenae]
MLLHTTVPVIILALTGYGLTATDIADTAQALSAEEFLAGHRQIAVGRGASRKGREGMDDSLTFTAITNPADNVVLIQAFTEGADPEDWDAALYSVALVGDQKAWHFFEHLQQQEPHRKRASCDGYPSKVRSCL